MKSQSFIALVLVTVLAVGAAGASVWQRQKNIELPDLPKTLFPGLIDKINDVAALSIVTPTSKFSINKNEDGTWGVPERGGYPVKFETVKQAVVGMISLKPMAAKTKRADNYAKLNVDDPANGGGGKIITFIDANGENLSALTIGTTKSGSTDTRLGWYYVRRPDQERAWLVEGRIDTWEDVTRWLDSSMPTVARTRIWSATSIAEDGSQAVVIREHPGKDNFEVQDLPEGKKVAYSTGPNALGSAMGFLSFDDVKSVEDVKDWIVVHTTQFRTFDGLIVELKVFAGEQDEKWVQFDFSTDFEALESLSIPDEQKKHLKGKEVVEKEATDNQNQFGKWAFKLPDYKIKDLLTGLNDLTTEDEKRE
jgi:hypothetical protein